MCVPIENASPAPTGCSLDIDTQDCSIFLLGHNEERLSDIGDKPNGSYEEMQRKEESQSCR